MAENEIIEDVTVEEGVYVPHEWLDEPGDPLPVAQWLGEMDAQIAANAADCKANKEAWDSSSQKLPIVEVAGNLLLVQFKQPDGSWVRLRCQGSATQVQARAYGSSEWVPLA